MSNRKSLLTKLGETVDRYRASKQTAESSNSEAESGVMRRLQWFLPNGGTVLVVLALILTQQIWARPQQSTTSASISTIPYQGRLADASGNPVTDKQNMEFRLYNVPTGGAPLWEEFWTGANSVNVSDGLFSVMLGSINTDLTSVLQGHETLYLGITVGTDSEMEPRVQLGSVPFSVWSLTVADDSITADKIVDDAVGSSEIALDAVGNNEIRADAINTEQLVDGAVTLVKLDSTVWADLPLSEGFHSPPTSDWQTAQYCRIGDIIYLRGLITKDESADIDKDDHVAFLPVGYRPPFNLAFVTEPHEYLKTKHRVDILGDGTVRVSQPAGSTPHVSLDGISFSISP